MAGRIVISAMVLIAVSASAVLRRGYTAPCGGLRDTLDPRLRGD
jgi:hypothetical protein